MTRPNDGGPAFPVPTISGPDLTVSYPEHVRGLTLRDYYAAHASDADIDLWQIDLAKRGSRASRAAARFAHADAMLAAREARNA